MSIATNILKRKGSKHYQARVYVPKDLQARLGKAGRPRTQIWKSLDTTDSREAKRLGAIFREQWERRFDDMRQTKKLSEAEWQNAVWRRYLEVINADEKLRQSVPTVEDLDEIWKQLEKEFGENDIQAFRIFETVRDTHETDRRQRIARLAVLRSEAARGTTGSIADAVEAVVGERQLDVAPGSADFRKLAHGLQRADIEALKRTVERDGGDFGGLPTDPAVKPPTVFDKPKGEQILVLFDKYARERPGRVSKDTWDQSRKVVALFDDFVGGNAHISELNRKSVREWKDRLFLWPVKAIESKVFRGLSFLDVIERNKTVGKPVIQGKTINRYLSALGGFCDWLLANDYVREKVMDGMYLELDRNRKTVLPYNERQLQQIFTSPLFHRCAGDKREREVGKVEIRDWRYWIPLIAVYSGARLGEICQLQVSDVRQLHGVWIFHITEEGAGGKSVKTGGSERIVPVHSKLIEIGLLKFHKRAQAMGHTQLFPEMQPDARGYISGKASGFFGEYFTEIGVKTDRTHNFHSLRHSVADAFRRAGYLDEQFGMLLGHTKASTTGKYGIMPEGPLRDRLTMIEALSFSF